MKSYSIFQTNYRDIKMNDRRFEMRHTTPKMMLEMIESSADTTIERWKDIKGFSNYQVSSIGRVRKNTYTDRCNCVRPQRIISQVLNKNGYYYVTLIDETGKHHFRTVHRLVAMAFLGVPASKHAKRPEVSHIDGNMTNNAADNLRWNVETTIEEKKEVVKKASGWRKSVVQIDPETGEVVGRYESQTGAAAAVGVSQSSLSRAVRWKIMAGGYYWKYV